MSRMIWTILGAILALWLAFTAIGWMVAMLKGAVAQSRDPCLLSATSGLALACPPCM
jgi:uncharacterized membrane protein SpoIIM required for sporulation